MISIRTYITVGDQPPAASDLVVETQLTAGGGTETKVAPGAPGGEIVIEALHEKLARQLAGK
jgi:hypothetical protein